ncbi:MAG: hypothetical protein ACE5JO_09110 [Candidatus Binatia bacterium]
MKLSSTQLETIRLMKHGWELTDNKTMYGMPWVQQGGSGRGGKSKRIGSRTFQALRKNGLIQPNKHGFPFTTWKLTKKGLEVVT